MGYSIAFEMGTIMESSGFSDEQSHFQSSHFLIWSIYLFICSRAERWFSFRTLAWRRGWRRRNNIFIRSTADGTIRIIHSRAEEHRRVHQLWQMRKLILCEPQCKKPSQACHSLWFSLRRSHLALDAELIIWCPRNTKMCSPPSVSRRAESLRRSLSNPKICLWVNGFEYRWIDCASMCVCECQTDRDRRCLFNCFGKLLRPGWEAFELTRGCNRIADWQWETFWVLSI